MQISTRKSNAMLTRMTAEDRGRLRKFPRVVKSLRVLIVEDEWLIAMDLAETLRQAGHDVVAIAADSDEALSAAHATAPELVLMDLRLANGSSGVEAARRLRDETKLRCIFVSANLDEATLRRLESLEPLGFVAKPILPARLKQAMGMAEIALATAG
jgi:CheY-like chemotaxis protein